MWLMIQNSVVLYFNRFSVSFYCGQKNIVQYVQFSFHLYPSIQCRHLNCSYTLALVLSLFLFWSGLCIRVGYETNNEVKRKNELNLHLSKSLHSILDSCIMGQPSLGAIVFSKFHPMRYILLPPEHGYGWSPCTSHRHPV